MNTSDRDSARNISVLINYTLPDANVRDIAEAHPDVTLLRAYTMPDTDARARGDEGTQLEGDDLLDMVREAEILFGFRFPVDWLDIAGNLKWVQLASAGSDHMLRQGLGERRPDLLLTTASGIHEIPISEHIVAMILHFSRGFNKAVRAQASGKWAKFRADEAYDKTVCFIGYGPIARRAARLCKALGMKVIAVRASIAEQQPGFEATDRFYPTSDLNDVLAQSDYVVVAAPHTPRSEKMIGREQLGAMKSNTVLINISRGALVDEAALIDGLQSGAIAGAGLDVFEQEPLPESSPLWALPNVLITPHVSGSNPHYDSRVTQLFIDNLTRYKNGEKLRNLVDMERGY